MAKVAIFAFNGFDCESETFDMKERCRSDRRVEERMEERYARGSKTLVAYCRF